MAKKLNLRNGLYPIAAALLVVSTIQASVAQEQSGARTAGGSDHSAAPADTKGGQEADTPISVQPRGQRRDDNARAQQQSFKTMPLESLRAHPAIPSAGSNAVRRNAIGQPIVPADVMQRYNAMPFSHPQTQALAVPASRIRSTNGSIGVTRILLPQASPALSRGRIDGSFARRNAPLSGLGGPAMPIAGINGTTIRSKH